MEFIRTVCEFIEFESTPRHTKFKKNEEPNPYSSVEFKYSSVEFKYSSQEFKYSSQEFTRIQIQFTRIQIQFTRIQIQYTRIHMNSSEFKYKLLVKIFIS